MNPESVPVILVIGVILIVFYLLLSGIRIVQQYERLVVFRLGVSAGTRGPGVVFITPFFETAKRVDTRERFLEIPRQTVISRDNVTIAIDFLMYYRIVDPALSVTQVDDVIRASLGVAATTIRSVIGDIELDGVLSKREQINDTLRVKLDEVTERWGLKVTRVEIREVEPPRDVQEAMNRQMTAERQRRATVTTAEGAREASIMVAEGEKQAAVLRAEGQKQAAILEAEGQRQAQLLKSQGFAAGLEALHKEAVGLDNNTMLLQYLEVLRTVGASASTKFILPMEVTALMQSFGAMMNGRSESAQTQPVNGVHQPEA